MEILECHLYNQAEISSACMPFVKNGGLFIKTTMHYPLGTSLTIHLKLLDNPIAIRFTAQVVWMTPQNAQDQIPQGIGVQFCDEEAESVRKAIQAVLPSAFLDSTKE